MAGATQRLDELVLTFGMIDLVEFKRRLKKAIRYIVPTMTEHIFKEDNILYPLAIDAVHDPQVWTRLKMLCEEIGYCCFETAW